MNRSQTDTLELLLFRVETLARHGKIEALGLEWTEVAERLNASGHGAKDPVLASTGEHVAFDVSLLETSNKSKTGYAGVNATTGSSFRALVPDVEQGGSRYLASRPTALQAAIDRFEWFDRHGLPYGNLGRNVEHWQKMRPQWSMEEILVFLRDDALGGHAGDLKWPYTATQAEQTLAAYCKRNGLKSSTATNPIEPEPATGEVVCLVCKEPIEDGNDLAIYGKGFSHKSCVPVS